MKRAISVTPAAGAMTGDAARVSALGEIKVGGHHTLLVDHEKMIFRFRLEPLDDTSPSAQAAIQEDREACERLALLWTSLGYRAE
jgi:hypothetical protein